MQTSVSVALACMVLFAAVFAQDSFVPVFDAPAPGTNDPSPAPASVPLPDFNGPLATPPNFVPDFNPTAVAPSPASVPLPDFNGPLATPPNFVPDFNPTAVAPVPPTPFIPDFNVSPATPPFLSIDFLFSSVQVGASPPTFVPTFGAPALSTSQLQSIVDSILNEVPVSTFVASLPSAFVRPECTETYETGELLPNHVVCNSEASAEKYLAAITIDNTLTQGPPIDKANPGNYEAYVEQSYVIWVTKAPSVNSFFASSSASVNIVGVVLMTVGLLALVVAVAVFTVNAAKARKSRASSSRKSLLPTEQRRSSEQALLGGSRPSTDSSPRSSSTLAWTANVEV